MKDTSFEAYISDQAMIGRIKKSIKKEERDRVIDKACEWLLNNIDFYVETNYGEDFRVDIEQLLKDIRKAMEE
ncbi:MAG: hypothetical protein IJD27_02200 [Alistipes sp.]|nr:hypothetical protein [Alistipes sp.]